MVHLKVLPVVKMCRLLTTGCQNVPSFNSEPTTVPVTKQKKKKETGSVSSFDW